MNKICLCLMLPLVADALRFSEAKSSSKVFASLLQAEEQVFKEAIPEPLKALQKALEQAEMEVESACSPEARKRTRKHIQAKNWDALEKDVCMEGHGEELDALQKGTGDVADVGEWLDGDLQVPAELRAHETEQAMKSKGQICKKLPEMIYIGMGHSGSTTLSMQLNAHPELSYGQMKEHRFHFESGEEHNTGMYRKNFAVPCEKKAFDGSIGYIFYTPERIEALKKVLGPDVKILLMMRDPAKWMNSLYHNGGDGLSKGHNGCYADFLETWLKYYPRENFLIESSEDYFKDPQATINRIADHVGVSQYTYKDGYLNHASGRRRAQGMKQSKIIDYKADPHNVECARRLQILSNRTFGWAEKMIEAAKTGEKLDH